MLQRQKYLKNIVQQWHMRLLSDAKWLTFPERLHSPLMLTCLVEHFAYVVGTKKLDPAGRGLDHSYLWTIPTSGFLSFCGIPTLEFTLTSVLIVVWFIPWIFEHPCCETSLPLKCSTLSVRVFYSFANKCYELHAAIFFRQLLGAVIRRIRVVAHGIRLHVAGMIALVMG